MRRRFLRGLGDTRLLVAGPAGTVGVAGKCWLSEREDSRALTGVRDEGLGDGAGESSPGPPGAMSPAGAVKPSLGAPGLSAPPKVQAGAPARLLLGVITGESLRSRAGRDGGQAPAPPATGSSIRSSAAPDCASSRRFWVSVHNFSMRAIRRLYGSGMEDSSSDAKTTDSASSRMAAGE